jgi:hypothetical protein
MKLVPIVLLLAVPASFARTRIIQPHTILSEVQQPSGGFLPDTLNVIVGDTIQITNLTGRDSLARTTAPNVFAEYGSVTDEFTGPLRGFPGGVYVRGPSGVGGGGIDDNGPLILDYPADCPLEPGPACDCPTDQSPTQVGARTLCDNEPGQFRALPDEMWGYEEVSGGMITLMVEDLLTTAPTDIEDPDDAAYDWRQFDQEWNRAASFGKHAILALQWGDDTPSWIFDAPYNAVEVVIEDNVSGTNFTTNCGSSWSMGSIADPAYTGILNGILTAAGTRAKSNTAWVTATGNIQLHGDNRGTDEFREPSACEDRTPRDDILDTVNGDECHCNTRALAVAGVNRTTRLAYVTGQIDHIHNTAFWPELFVQIPLITGGYFSGESDTNYAGDYMCAAGTTPPCTFESMLCSTCGATPAIAKANDSLLVSSKNQLTEMIQVTQDTQGARVAWTNNALNTYPTEVGDNGGNGALQNCTWGGTVNLLSDPPGVEFPIPLVGEVTDQSGCPNREANQTSLSDPPRLTGWQSVNRGGGIYSPASVQSLAWNLLRNSNAPKVELFPDVLFWNHEENGSDGDMDPTRDDIPTPSGIDPEVAETFSMEEFDRMLRDRRDNDLFVAQYSGVEPNSYFFDITVDVDHTAANPRTCNLDLGACAGTLTINVSP